VWLSVFNNPKLPSQFEEDRQQIIIFRRYLAIMFGLFTLGLLCELIIDFKIFEAWSFLVVQVSCLFFFLLSVLHVPHRFVITLNILFILLSNQFTLLADPKTFHVLVFWIGITPLIVAVLTHVRVTLYWTVVIAFFILFNGLYISKEVGPYHLTVYPDRFLAAGIIFVITASCLAAFFSATQKRVREKMHQQNLQLIDLTKEIKLSNEQLKNYNDHLEERVFERTAELEHQNKQLSEYAFINSHLLRGPLARILGITDLLRRTNITPQQKEYIEHLNTSAEELDEVIAKINKALNQEGKFNRETFQKLKDRKYL
jgi:signal transduction histidine kinase